MLNLNHLKFIRMKQIIRIYSILGFLLLQINITQAQDLTFAKVYDDIANGMGVKANLIMPTFDTSYLLIGSNEIHNYSNITKVNQYGDVIWGKTYSFNNYFNFDLNCGTPTYDSAFVIAGSIKNESTDKTDNFLMKINESGDTLWTSTFGTADVSSYPLSVEQSNDSGFIISGYYLHPNPVKYCINVLKTDKYGQLEWAKEIVLGDYMNISYCAKQTTDTTYVLTGKFKDDPPSVNYSFVMNLSSTGDVNWVKKMWIDGELMGINDFMLDGNDLFLFFENMDHIGLMKTDSAANILWSKEFTNQENEHALELPSKKMQRTSDGGFVFPYGNTYFWGGVLKADVQGNTIWHNNIAFMVEGISETINHEYLVLGTGPIQGVKGYYQMGLNQLTSQGIGSECSWQSEVTAEDIIINSEQAEYVINTVVLNTISNTIDVGDNIIITKDGCVDFYGAVDETDSNKNLSIYPNPNHGVFSIEMLQEGQKRELKIYNILGELTDRIAIHTHLQSIDLSHHQAGTYFYSIQSESSVLSSGTFIILEH